MSYGMAAALQAGIFARLAGDPNLAALIGGAIFDAVPGGVLPETYVTLGDEDVRDRSSADGMSVRHDFAVRVVTGAGGFRDAKAIAGAVSDALLRAPVDLARGRIVGLWFLRGRARRVGSGDQRQIEMRFRALVEDS